MDEPSSWTQVNQLGENSASIFRAQQRKWDYKHQIWRVAKIPVEKFTLLLLGRAPFAVVKEQTSLAWLAILESPPEDSIYGTLTQQPV